MSNRLQNYINTEETERAKNDGLIQTQYSGSNPEIKGKKGTAYFVPREDKWYFTPTGGSEEYRVDETSLDFER
jgi:hypothetical protein